MHDIKHQICALTSQGLHLIRLYFLENKITEIPVNKTKITSYYVDGNDNFCFGDYKKVYLDSNSMIRINLDNGAVIKEEDFTVLNVLDIITIIQRQNKN